MDGVGKELVELLQYLLPGFLTAWIFYWFTSFSKPQQFERIIEALIFTVFAQVLVFPSRVLLLLLGKKVVIGPWDKTAQTFWSFLWAVILGFVFSYLANSDRIHEILRKWKFTCNTSHPSEWVGAFMEHKTFVVLHLEDERRIYGYPLEWPNDPLTGHFRISQADWLDGEKVIQIKGVEAILIPAKSVSWVEFVKIDREKKDEQENT